MQILYEKGCILFGDVLARQESFWRGSVGYPPIPMRYVSGGERLKREMKVYVLQSEADGSQYVGMPDDVERRLKEHNAGKVRSTKEKGPWKVVCIEEFADRKEARTREKYLKSAAGRRFRKKLMGM